ncbi:MOSC domain-containing protein [Priestia megaterium]|nr:MOSC domain-containing protein [Priestia megaterium]MUL34761.1 6-N-hydroxylaminopurine resistance protein [Priestia megaterium]
MMPRIINLAIGTPKEYNWNHEAKLSGIGKTSTKVAELKKVGFVGDEVGNKEKHGGVDRAVCLYPFEHYSYWEKILRKKMVLPAFGENITAMGMTEKQVCIGDVYQMGDAIVQVTQGRVPCDTISKYNEEKHLLKKVVETSLTGYFFRVLEEGAIKNNSEINVIDRHPRRISVAFATKILFHQHQDKESIEKILRVDDLSEEWRNRFLKL